MAESYGPTRVRFDRPLAERGLAGRLLRCGPARLHRGDSAHDHWFDGDGMVHSFTLEGQHLRHRARMVRTTRYVAEDGGRPLRVAVLRHRASGRRPVRSPDDVNTANTAVLPVGDELLALWEGGSPWRLDAGTLETLGRAVLSPPTDGLPFSAHPRLDTDGTLWNFGYAAGSGVLLLYALDRCGRLVRTGLVGAPNADSVHDFAITERFLVFTLFPLVQDAAATGPDVSVLDRLHWREDSPVVVLLIDKRTLDVAHRFSLEPFFAYHFGNAWDDGDSVRLEVARSPDFESLMDAVRLATRGRASPRLRPTRRRWTSSSIRAPARRPSSRCRSPGLEFPTYDERRTGRPTSRLFGMTANASLPADAFGHNELVGFHRRSGGVRRHDFGATVLAEEHVHAPGPVGARRGRLGYRHVLRLAGEPHVAERVRRRRRVGGADRRRDVALCATVGVAWPLHSRLIPRPALPARRPYVPSPGDGVLRQLAITSLGCALIAVALVVAGAEPGQVRVPLDPRALAADRHQHDGAVHDRAPSPSRRVRLANGVRGHERRVRGDRFSRSVCCWPAWRSGSRCPAHAWLDGRRRLECGGAHDARRVARLHAALPIARPARRASLPLPPRTHGGRRPRG